MCLLWVYGQVFADPCNMVPPHCSLACPLSSYSGPLLYDIFLLLWYSHCQINSTFPSNILRYKLKIFNIISQLNKSNELKHISNVLTNDFKLNFAINLYLNNQVEERLKENNYTYFEKDLDIIDALNEVKKVID